MKFTLERTGANVVHACAPGEIRIREDTYRNNLILTAGQIITPWAAAAPTELTVTHFEAVLGLEPDIIVLGTGDTIEFPPPALSGAILARGIGLEVMDTIAACRTYNVLVHEQRRVAAALILDPAA